VQGKLGEVVESGAQELMHPRDVDAQIAVDQHVAKSGDAPKPARKFRRQHAELAERIHGARIVRGIAPRARRQMSRDVESVLRAELESTFDGPEQVGVGAQARERPAGVAPESLDGFIEGQQMAPDDRGIGLPGGHRPNRAASIRALCAASIFASWGP